MDIHCADLTLGVIARKQTGQASSFCCHQSGAYSGQSYSHHSFSYQQTMRRKTAPVCCCVSNVQIPSRQQFFLVTALLRPFPILLDGKLPRSARHHTRLDSRISGAVCRKPALFDAYKYLIVLCPYRELQFMSVHLLSPCFFLLPAAFHPA